MLSRGSMLFATDGVIQLVSDGMWVYCRQTGQVRHDTITAGAVWASWRTSGGAWRPAGYAVLRQWTPNCLQAPAKLLKKKVRVGQADKIKSGQEWWSFRLVAKNHILLSFSWGFHLWCKIRWFLWNGSITSKRDGIITICFHWDLHFGIFGLCRNKCIKVIV